MNLILLKSIKANRIVRFAIQLDAKLFLQSHYSRAIFDNF